MEKILYNRLLRPVLAVVMVVSLALGVASSAWPAARQSARIEVLAEAGITNLRTRLKNKTADTARATRALVGS